MIALTLSALVAALVLVVLLARLPDPAPALCTRCQHPAHEGRCSHPAYSRHVHYLCQCCGGER